ncbi:transmembrane protein 234 isoform X2 [Hypomesus transpacificus]|uniref:transmembrane protein 234 isoform X2 n=1 Tax=Hypomesus transpacificus TaxID=137520 RepID=UPI001F077795|nr:transmembrane protein 234 isoform X2 [Hypomesus transpacificus]
MFTMVSLVEVMCLVLVAVLWGCTNPFLKRGTEGIEHVKHSTKLLQFMAEIKFLFLNVKYLIPFLLNQSGSVIYYFTLATTGKLLGEEFGGKKEVAGMILTMTGITVCVISSITETKMTQQQNITHTSP